MAAATAGLCCCCCCLSSPPLQTLESSAALLASISAGLLKPLSRSSLWSANSASSPSSRSSGLTEEERFPPRWALSNVGRMAPMKTYYREGDGGKPSRMVAEVYEQNGGPPLQERGPFPRPPVILWEKDVANAVQLIGRVGRDIEIKYLNSGKVVATTSLAVHKGSQRTEDPSWFTLEIWDDLAEITAHHVAKGELIRVAGKIVLDSRVRDDVRYTNVKVVVRDLCFVEPSSDRRQPYGNSNDKFTVRGSSSQSQGEVASMNSSQRKWNQRQLPSQPSQGAVAGFHGARGHSNNVVQLEAQTPQTRAGASKWREAAKMIEHMHSASTTSQAIAVLQDRLQRGITTDANKYVKVLKMCLNQKDLLATKQVHDCIIQSRMDKNLYVAGNLLNVYIKCGGLVDARRVFDQLEKKGVIAWTSMIAGYAKSDHAESALELFNQMRQEGVEPNEITYLSILKACTSLLALKWGKEIHECIRHAGFESDVRVGTALLQMYAKCECIAEARRVFEKLTNRDVMTWTVMIDGLAQHGCEQEAYRLFLQMRQEGFEPNAFTWTAMIGGLAQHGCEQEAYRLFLQMRQEGFEPNSFTWTVMIGGLAQDGCGHEAYRLFCQMRQAGFEPDAITYLSILNASATAGPLEWVKEVHGHASKAGLESDLRVGTALVHIYAESGNIDDARQVFDRMEKRDIVTWNVMIGGLAQHGSGHEAYGLFRQMRQEGFEPDAFTYANILNASASAGALEWVKEVHGHASKAGLESDLRVGNALVHMYAESGSIDDARRVFDRMEKRNVVTWNVMIGGLAQHGSGDESYRLFRQMSQEGFEPDAITYASILNASASAGALEWVKEVHGHASKAGLESDLRVGNALVHMYAESGSIDDARRVFDRMEKRNVVTWNVMIGGLAKHGCGHEAYRLFRQMRQEDLEPNAITYLSILNASATAGALEWVKEVHGHASKAGLESDLRVGNALVHMYAKSGSVDDARRVFDRMEKRDAVTWNVMIGGLAQHESGHEAYGLFRQMRQEGFEPDAFTYASILNASASAGALEWVKEVHGHASKAGLESDLRVGNALVHMYAESGSIDDARRVFDRMEKRDVVTWNVMIGGLAHHGCGHEALALFREMNADLVKPDGTTFLAVLSACCHGGLVDDGRRLFSAITEDYGIEPEIFHYNCMVDLLGRAGYLEEAKKFISDMSVEPVVVTWTALLGACRTYGNVELGELAANELFELEPSRASTYVLLSNIYAAAGKWEKVSLVRTMMQQRGVRKEPGRSWIEVDNKIHEFVVGDKSHPEAKAIYTELSQLTEKLKGEGYIPDTRLVLHDINEEDKELALCSHSEKLAIAYGLIHIPPGEPIRVEKNLRVCPDCHTATKLISKVTGREIIARDVNRFHHFKDGVCSCGDYW